MKLHEPLIKGLKLGLEDIFFDGYYADKVISHHFKLNKKWGSRDRKFFAEGLYDLTRRWLYLWSCIGKTPPIIKDDKTNKDLYKIIKVYLINQGFDTSTSKTLENLHVGKAVDLEAPITGYYPVWIVNLFKADYPDTYLDILKSLNNKASVFLRTNSLKIKPKDLVDRLEKEGIPTEIDSRVDGAVRLVYRNNVFATQAFADGCFEVQDISSQRVGVFCNIKPGDRIIDACAGAGGKSLQMASLLNNKGKIISLDIHERKLKELRRRSSRAGVDIIETRLIDSTKVIKRLKAKADILLLDVPCSGLGVIKRNPDTIWKLTKERIDELIKIQEQILNDYVSMLKPGGALVYATCSLLKAENEEQIDKFIKSHPNFKVEEQLYCLPSESNCDGFFMARLKHQA